MPWCLQENSSSCGPGTGCRLHQWGETCARGDKNICQKRRANTWKTGKAQRSSEDLRLCQLPSTPSFYTGLQSQNPSCPRQFQEDGVLVQDASALRL
ncbi:hypothetical protein H8959_004344 [Pygathrix nigripes]